MPRGFPPSRNDGVFFGNGQRVFEKTAILASAAEQGFVWLACGGIGGLSPERCRVLRGRRVVLFPDLNAIDQWRQKALELSPIVMMEVSPFLQYHATAAEQKAGYDLGDYVAGQGQAFKVSGA